MNALFFIYGVLAVIGYTLCSIICIEQAEKLGINISNKDNAIIMLTSIFIVLTALIIGENS